jgi:hypothetical protein
MAGYLYWVERLPGEPVLITNPAEPDQLFLYWYLHRFTGRWPFAGTRTESGQDRRFGCRSLCPLARCRVTPVPLARSS